MSVLVSNFGGSIRNVVIFNNLSLFGIIFGGVEFDKVVDFVEIYDIYEDGKSKNFIDI